MGIYSNNRVLIISLALAASGLLTCGLALSDIFLPRGSAIVVLVSIPLLAAIAFGVLVIFAWTCELLDRRGWPRFPRRTTRKANKPWHIISARRPNPASLDERQSKPTASTPPLGRLIDYPVNLRGTMHFQGIRHNSNWHGQ